LSSIYRSREEITVRKNVKTKLGLATVVALALGAFAAVPAHADYQPSGTDVVGVGGDTPQYALDFLADGAFGAPGFNGANDVNKLVYFNATADGNGRAAYDNGTSTNLNPTDVLRAGSSPVERVQSSGAAISALLADTGTIHQINFVASASEPTAAQQAQAATNGWTSLHVVQIGGDSINIAAATNTNAPTGLSKTDLLNIYEGNYKHWNDIPGNSSGSPDAIIPLLPPTGSTINKNFLADLKTANGGTTPTLSGSVLTVEQNDPSAITNAATPADAIVPFSAARLALYNSSYFLDPNTVFPGGAALSPGIKLLTGTTPDPTATPTYVNNINLYIIFRQSDAVDGPWEPGSTLNWSQALFSNPNGTAIPYVAQPAGLALIAASGSTAKYVDLGPASSG
jgi:ABC-type phosphate transport system substrate-binding protein